MDKEVKKRWSMLLKKSIDSRKNKNEGNNILLIDGLNLFIRAFSVVPTTTEDGEHNGGVYGTLNSLKSAITKLNPSRCIIVFDGRGGSQRRRKLYSEYKNNRKGMRKLNKTFNWLSESHEEISCQNQLLKFIEYLEFLPITTFTVDNIEADDAIAYIVTNIYNDEKYKNIIMSSDKDYLQLVNDNVQVWSPTKRKLYTKDKIVEEFELNPEHIIFWRILDGDKSDNIPGIKGIGRKTVIKMFESFFKNSEKIPEIEDFFTYIDYLYNETEKKTKKLLDIYNNKPIIERNYKLMQLKDVNISGTSKSLILNNTTNSKIPLLNQIKLREKLLKDGLYSFIKNFSSWYSSFSSLNSHAIKFNKSINN